MNINESLKEKNVFITSIIESIKMNKSEFMKNLANEEKYETLIYGWLTNLFYKGKTIDEAIKIIHKKRIQAIQSINLSSNNEDDLAIFRNRQKVMSELNLIPIYSNLRDKDKYKIQPKIEALVDTRLYNHKEITDFIIEIIQNTISNKDSHKRNKIKSKSKRHSKDKNIDLLSEFKNLLIPITNETALQS